MLACDKALAALLAASMLAACSAIPEYQPQGPGELVGYSDMRPAANRYRVSFSGGSASTRDDVEIYLLSRAAEVTLQAGYTHFVFSSHDTERRTRYSYVFGGPPIYSYPSSSYWAGSAWPVGSYSTKAEILLLRPEEAVRNTNATEAESILRVW